ncbi:MAG: hypothetical protein AB1611_00750 [bacterium]
MRVIFLSLLFSCAFLVYAKSFAVDERNPHTWSNDENHTFCRECHANDPNTVVSYLDVRLKQGVTASCMRGDEGINGTKCHSVEKLGRTHSVDVEPGKDMKIPEDLHLDENMRITCVTCHNPHGNWTSSIPMVARETRVAGTNQYRSYFLRRTNIRSALCIACHDKQ